MSLCPHMSVNNVSIIISEIEWGMYTIQCIGPIPYLGPDLNEHPSSFNIFFLLKVGGCGSSVEYILGNVLYQTR